MKLISRIRLFPKIGMPLIFAVFFPFLIFIPPTIAQDSGSLTLAPLNPEFLEYFYRAQTSRVQTETSDGFALGLIPSPIDLSHLIETPLYGKEKLLTAPSSYDLRSLGKLTPVKDQGNCGSCWSFATYASVESNLLPTETWDFSENNLKNTHGFDYGHCDGGNATMSTAYLSRWSGPVNETDDPYNPYSSISPAGLTVRKHLQEVLIIPNRASPSDNENIKQAIISYGALYTTMYFDFAYYNSTYKTYYYNGTNTNHAVAIVGWNDNFDRNKFSIIPPGNGAFIIKNSWGTGFGENGYFYVSYYDTIIGTNNFLFTWVESTTNYTRIYQYDPLGWISGVGYGTGTAWFSNIFMASSSEQVAAVSFYTASLNSSYELSIYTNTTAGPTSGILGGTKTGTIPWPGYHTIVLDEPVPLTSGQRFSVVVKLTTPGYNYPVSMERPIDGWSSGATASSGQSYLSSNGTSWTDISLYYENTNVCLKAFTIPIARLTIGSPNGGETWPTGSTKTITWASYDINLSGSLHIFYWYDNDWQEIAGPLSAETASYAWNIPDTPTASTGIWMGNWVNEAWEAYDQSDQSFILEKVSSPNRPSGPTLGSNNTSYTYTTTGSSSSAGHSVQYFFDWGDGTNSGWLPVGTTSASKSWASGGTYSVKAQARCGTHTSVVSGWSGTFSVSIEEISTPSVPGGPNTGVTGASYTYSTGGSSSNVGHSIQYLFDWGDGTDSGWLPIGQTSTSKSWGSAKEYGVRAKARCATDISLESGWSQLLNVTISSPNVNAPQGTLGTEITVTASGFGTKKGKLLIGGVATKIINWSPTSVTGVITKTLSPGIAYDVVLQPKEPKGVAPISIPGAFTMMAPAITSVDPISGARPDEIVVSGNYFSTKKGKVYLEDPNTGMTKTCKVTSWGMNSITFVVPKTSKTFPLGTYHLKVTNKVGTDYAPSDFIVD
jgi:C1A family cysteine protease